LLVAVNVKSSKGMLYTIEADSNQFTQNFDTIVVGDTVKWVWVAGSHTTTSNGIPPGATTWNVLLDDHHTSFTYVVLFGGTYDYISVPDAPLMGGEFVAMWPTGISNPSMAVSDFNIIGNPSRNTIEFHFTLAKPSEEFVDVSLYNILGTKIQTLYHGNISSGSFSETVSLASSISRGIYLVTLKIGDAILTKRVVIQ
jgi:plastocyanin